MNNATDSTFSLFTTFDYVSCVYMAAVITAGTYLNITSMVRIFDAIKVSFISL